MPGLQRLLPFPPFRLVSLLPGSAKAHPILRFVSALRFPCCILEAQNRELWFEAALEGTSETWSVSDAAPNLGDSGWLAP